LASFHKRLPPPGDATRPEYEVYYVDRATLRRFAPGQRHVKVGPDDPLGWTDHRPSWVLERWVVREHGVTLAGPDPKTLIDPVSQDDLRWAAIGEITARLRNWDEGSWPISEMAHLGSQSFEVETVCRALYTFETGEMVAKADAIAWAVSSLPGEWHELIRWSRAGRKQLTRDPARVPEVLEFLRWAVARASAAG